MITQNNRKVLNRKEWQMMSPAPTTSAAGSFIIKDPAGERRTALYVASATVQHIYAADEDGWMQIPSMALAGTFGAGACGTWGCWSNTLTANGGTTTSLTLAASITDLSNDRIIKFLTGANAGEEVVVSSTVVNIVGNNIINFKTALPNVVSSGDTFQVRSGKYYILNAGTLATGSFKSFDPLTGAYTSLSITGLPASWGTEGKMVATPSYVGDFATGTATSATGTTLVNSAKTWTINQWCNYQVKITGGKGKGQVRSITTNTATTLTVPTWTTTPDNTSTYAIQGNDDYLYLLGNNSVTMYRYSISGNSWSTIAPTAARASALVTGGSANWVSVSGNSTWADESNIQDGRYIYSFRGGATSNMDRYNISGGTAGAGTWDSTVAFLNKQETFSTGSSFDVDGQYIYMVKESTGRVFKFDVVSNSLYPFSIDFYSDSTAVNGDKLFTVSYKDNSGGDTITWLYRVGNTLTTLRRIMIY